MKNICFITSTRADYGLIEPVIRKVKKNINLNLQLIVMGTHTSSLYGKTINDIISDGYQPNFIFETAPDDDSKKSISKAIADTTCVISDALLSLKPDLIVIPGDRYEMLGASTSALIIGVPILHLYGGDLTIGSFDDSIRHSITKMASLHCCTNELSRKRIIQMGEDPKRVFNTGSPALDQLSYFKIKPKKEIEKELNLKFLDTNFLVTFHPVTRDTNPSKKQMKFLLEAISTFDDTHFFLFTMPNADTEGLSLSKMIEDFSLMHKNVKYIKSLGHKNYFQTLSHMDIVIGNSSSGLMEVPSFGIPTVNIGIRQKGRLKSESIIDCSPKRDNIISAINFAKNLNCKKVKNPYGDGNSSQKVLNVILSIKNFRKLLTKKFHEE